MEKRQTLTGRHCRQGGEKSITGHIISREFNQDMGDRKANLTTVANRESFTSHQMTMCNTNMTNTKTGQRNFQVATPLGTRRLWTKGRFQPSQLMAIHNTLVPTGLPGGTANRGNVVMKG